MGDTIFMTGATSGLGEVSALKAAKNGATVLVLARNKDKGQELINKFESQHPKSEGSIVIIEGNLSDLKSVVKACDQVTKEYPKLDMIVNNAGIMAFEHKKSVDQIEETFQVNLLAPILICHLLYDKMDKEKGSKIIFTSSGLHQGNINFDNLEFDDSFSSFKVYRQSKLGVILFCRLLAPVLKKDNIDIYSQHPGVVKTDLGRDANWFMRIIFSLMGRSAEKGSQTLTYLIETPQAELETGEYYADSMVTKTTDESYDLKTAGKLMGVVKDYLKEHISASSPIFN